MDTNHFPVADSEPYHGALAQAIDHWGLSTESTVLLRDGVNHVFSAVTAAGVRVIVRIGDGAARQRGEVEGELLWLAHLIENGCVVCEPIPSRRGALLESMEVSAGSYHVCCFRYLKGRHLDPATDPEWNNALLHRLGRAIGKMHRVSDQFHLPPEHDRRPWYDCNLSQIPNPLPPGFDPRLEEPMQEFLKSMRHRETESYSYGLVHRDLHAGNLLVEQGEMKIIDFDLGCYGWRVMDFAVLLFSQYLLPSLRIPSASPRTMAKVLGTVVRGYREEYEIDAKSFEVLNDILRIRDIIFYVVASPAVEHWQVAMGNPRPTVAESLEWIRERWLRGEGYQVDLSYID